MTNNNKNTTKSTKEKQENKSRERILITAARLFAQKGFEGTSIREICTNAGANICMVSYFWGGKKELYQAILNDMLRRHSEFTKEFFDFDLDISSLEKKEQIKLLYLFADKEVEFTYNSSYSSDLIKFLTAAQFDKNIKFTSPVFVYLRKLLGVIFNKNADSSDIVYKAVSIISLINGAKIIPFSALGIEDDLNKKEDVDIIKANVRLYLNSLLIEQYSHIRSTQ